MPGLKEDLSCPRRMAVFAVFDVIDSLRGKYEKAMAGDIKARVNVLGRTSVTELSSEESILHISLLQTMERLTEEEKQLSLRYIMDSVLYHIDKA